MPSRLTIFGQARQAPHRRFSQFVTMASCTLTPGRFPGLVFNVLSVRFTLFRQAFTALRSITTRNIARTQLLAEPSPLEVRALGALPHGKLKLGNGVTRSFAPRSLRRNATPFRGYAQGGVKAFDAGFTPSDIGHLAHGVAG